MTPSPKMLIKFMRPMFNAGDSKLLPGLRNANLFETPSLKPTDIPFTSDLSFAAFTHYSGILQYITSSSNKAKLVNKYSNTRKNRMR